MKKVIFPSETPITVSLVKYATIVGSGPTVIDKKCRKNWKNVSAIVKLLNQHSTLKITWKIRRKNVLAFASTRGCDWLILKKIRKEVKKSTNKGK